MIPFNNCKTAETATAAQNSSSQAQQKSAADTKAVVLAGRKVVVPTNRDDLAIGSHSFIDKFLLQVAFNTGMDLADMKASSLKFMGPLMPMLKQAEQMMTQILMKEEHENLALIVQSQVQSEIQKLSSEMHHNFALAGVRSYSELVKKQKTIEGFKSLAWKKFCSDPKALASKV